LAANGAVAALAASAETTVGAATSKVLAVTPTDSAPLPMSAAATGAANCAAVWNCVGTAAAAGDVIEDGGAADGAPSMM